MSCSSSLASLISPPASVPHPSRGSSSSAAPASSRFSSFPLPLLALTATAMQFTASIHPLKPHFVMSFPCSNPFWGSPMPTAKPT